MEQETRWCDQNGQLLPPEEYSWLLGPGGDPRPPVAPPTSAWYGSWGGGMPQWHMPGWGYLPTHTNLKHLLLVTACLQEAQGPDYLLLVTACLKEAQAAAPKDPKMQWMKKMTKETQWLLPLTACNV